MPGSGPAFVVRELRISSARAAEAAAAYEQAHEGVGTLQNEVDRLTRQAAQLEHADRKYELALEAVATATPTPFADTTGPATDAVRELARIRETCEIERTTTVARSALQSLVAAHEVLRRANSWSTFDNFLSDMKVFNEIHRCRDDVARSVAAVEKVLAVLDQRRVELSADDAPGELNR
ncbi:MAG: hypothetical protein L0H96_00840 [Humibacillus sp.]|nr:hypothetical protein [Humibacillus sp.]MDN5775444.1 hypothetical protein [Humibacillus sp.]